MSRGAWIWPFRFPASAAAAAWSLAGFLEKLYRGWTWLPAAAVVGALPVLLCYGAGGASMHQPISALLLFLLFLPAVKGNRELKGLLAVLVVFAVHSLLSILLAMADPARAALLLPDGLAYWEKQLAWIRTGHDPEYEVAAWLPAHGGLFAAMAGFGYLSLGAVPFDQGFRQVDLMNYYVGRLLAEGGSPAVALLVGWHPWSVARGLCFAFLCFETASWSLERMTGRVLSTPKARRRRWLLALAFFALDCGLKVTLVEPVRASLAASLRGR